MVLLGPKGKEIVIRRGGKKWRKEREVPSSNYKKGWTSQTAGSWELCPRADVITDLKQQDAQSQ